MEMIYFDSGATTAMDPRVVDYMADLMKTTYGNPSSTHKFGRNAKAIVEGSRKRIAAALNCNSSEIIFTSSGSEADNLVLRNAVKNLGVTRIISTPVEHAAVLKTVECLGENNNVEVVMLDLDHAGQVDLNQLQTLLSDSDAKTLVSLMYVNNEIGTILDVKKVSEICQEHKALFHTDGVQAVGHLPIDMEAIEVDFLVGSAHKFHGPKGVGFAYFKKGHGVQSMFTGGGQEKGARAGTENVHSIAGMAEALDFAVQDMEEDSKHILSVKKYMIEQLKDFMPSIKFNAGSDDLKNSAYHILSVQFPGNAPMLLFSLDINGVAVSGGSACQSGSNKGSHVLNAILSEEENQNTSVRISFSKYNKLSDVDRFIEVLKSL